MNVDQTISTLKKGKSKDKVAAYKTLLENNGKDETTLQAMAEQLIKEPNANTFHLVAQLELGRHYFERDDIKLGITRLPWLWILHQRIVKCKNVDSRCKAIYWLIAFHRRTNEDNLDSLTLLKDLAISDKEKSVRFTALQCFMEYHRGTTDSSIFNFLIRRYDECTDPNEKTLVYSKIYFLGLTPELQAFLEKELETQPMREPSALAERFCAYPYECIDLMPRFFEIFQYYYSQETTTSKNLLNEIQRGLFIFIETLFKTDKKPDEVQLLNKDDFLLYLAEIAEEKLKTVGNQISPSTASTLFKNIGNFCRYFHDNPDVSRAVITNLVQCIDDGAPSMPEIERYHMLKNLIEFNKKHNIPPQSTLASLEPWWQKQSKALHDLINEGEFGIDHSPKSVTPPIAEKPTERNLKESIETAQKFLNFISPSATKKERDTVWALWKNNIETARIVNDDDLLFTVLYSTVEKNDMPTFSFIQDLKDYTTLPDHFDSMRESLKLNLDESLYINDQKISAAVSTQLSIFADYLHSKAIELISVDHGNDEYAIVAVAKRDLPAFTDFMKTELKSIKFDTFRTV